MQSGMIPCLVIILSLAQITNAQGPTHYAKGHYLENSHQKRLIDFIRNNTDPDVRPVENHTTPVNVTLDITLYQLLEADAVNQKIRISVWMEESWVDEILWWDPADFGGINRYRIKPDEIWRPDVYLYNNIEMDEAKSKRFLNVKLINKYPDEKYVIVKLHYPAIFETSCEFDITHFPFDIQNCMLLFGSWTYDIRVLDFHAKRYKFQFHNLIKNQEWELLDFYAQREVSKFDCCPAAYANVYYFLKIKRRPLFYIITLVIPSSIVVFVSFCGFFATAGSTDSNEKIALGLTTLLAIGVLLLQLADQMPKTSDTVPRLAVYFISLMFMIGFGTLMTVLIIHLRRHGEQHRPIPKVILTIQRFFMKSSRHNRKEDTSSFPLVNQEILLKRDNGDPRDNNDVTKEDLPQNGSTVALAHIDEDIDCSTSTAGMSPPKTLLQLMNKLDIYGGKFVNIPTKSLHKTSINFAQQLCYGSKSSIEGFERNTKFWFSLALTIERGCLVIFAGGTIVVTILFFLLEA